jgi:hypothetical protein
LFVDTDGQAGTVYVDGHGKLVHGPFAGFGI